MTMIAITSRICIRYPPLMPAITPKTPRSHTIIQITATSQRILLNIHRILWWINNFSYWSFEQLCCQLYSRSDSYITGKKNGVNGEISLHPCTQYVIFPANSNNLISSHRSLSLWLSCFSGSISVVIPSAPLIVSQQYRPSHPTGFIFWWFVLLFNRPARFVHDDIFFIIKTISTFDHVLCSSSLILL